MRNDVLKTHLSIITIILVMMGFVILNGVPLAQARCNTDTHGMVIGTCEAPGYQTPLKQFKSGIPASDVKCADGVTLVVKSEDGSPACVKPDTASILVKRGWAKSTTNGISQTGLTSSQTALSSSNCIGREIPTHQSGSLVVLLMSPNSTATVCTTFQFYSDWDSYPNKFIYDGGVAHFGFSLGPKFNVTATPSLLNVTNASNNGTFSILYKISSAADSNGIYDNSLPWDTCGQYPLAVGYAGSNLKKSDFPLEVLLDRPCFNVIFHVDSNKIISGMDYAEVNVSGP